MHYFAAMQQTSTAKLPVFSLKPKKNLSMEMLPIEIILDLGVTTSQNVMKEPYLRNLNLYFNP